jgi:glycine betaine/choline ABC-type transport system substrate-binding protein
VVRHAKPVPDRRSTLTQYAANVTTPAGQQNENAAALEAIVADIARLAALRHQVQLAAEQAFPWRTPGVAGIRKSFQLPTDRPMRG